MKLKNLRKVGRYTNPNTSRALNIWMGTKVGYGVDILFYYVSGKRVILNDSDFWGKWEKLS